MNQEEEKISSWKRCFRIDLTWYSSWILLLVAFLSLGSYWAFDIPGAIQSQLTFWFGGPYYYSDADNLLLYSIYSYPNIILAFCGGILVDCWTGLTYGTLLFVGLVFLGQIIFSLGIEGRSFLVVLIGRFIFGLGGESITVVQSTWTTRWFSSTQSLSFAFGFTVSIARLGSALNFLFTPSIVAETSVPVAVWVATILCAVSFAASVLLGIFDWHARSSGRLQLPEKSPEEAAAGVSLKHLLRFPLRLWLLCSICVFFYIAIIPLYAVASQIMQLSGTRRYSPRLASAFLSIPNLMAIVCIPLFGKLLDLLGLALWVMLASALLQALAVLMLLGNALRWWAVYPVYVFVVVGVAYSAFAAAFWPLVSRAARPSAVATAYGLSSSLQSAGIAVAAQIIGAIQDASGGEFQFVSPLIFFLGSLCIAIGLNVWLVIHDRLIHSNLNQIPHHHYTTLD